MDTRDLAAFRRTLRLWHKAHRRQLPWRETSDPYAIWVSEVMLQQTQVKTVIPYYERFITKFPTVFHLARAEMQSVLKLWEGLGYYARARNFLKAAQKVVAEHGGRIPDDIQTFRTLPGVGDYTAAAVQSIAFGHAAPVVDGNVKRVLARLQLLDAPANTSDAKPEFVALANRLLDRRHPGMSNEAMMELGALVCLPKRPLCGGCPVRQFCKALSAGVVDRYPKRVEKRTVPTHRIAVGVIRKGKTLLITQRKPEGLLGGLWEFPGGKIKRRETAAQACRREIGEEVNLEVAVTKRLTRVRHAYTHFKVVMDVFECQFISGRVRLSGPVGFKWVRPAHLAQYPFPRANNKFIPLLTDEGS